MTWTTEFISRALDGLPKDKYRQRAQAELSDHLLELADELEAGGCSSEDAQKRALELMGDPAQLNPSFRESWVHRASRWKYCLGAIVKSAIHALLFGLTIRWVMLMPITYMGKVGFHDWLESGMLLPNVLFSIIEFLPQFWFVSQELHERFAIHPQRRKMVFFGAVLLWLVDVGPLLSMLFAPFMYGMGGLTLSVLMGHSLLHLMGFGARWPFQFILGCSLVICLFFALFFRPRKSRLFPYCTPGGELP